MKNVVFIGFMGTGKSCVGRLLAEKISFSFADTDILVEQNCGMSIPEIFAQYGEKYFRSEEKKAVKEAAACSNIVISTGGGVPTFEENMAVLKKNSIIICLCASVNTILQRTKGRNNRPLLNSDKDKVQQLLDKRQPVYKKADFIIDTDDLSPLQIVNEIMLYLKRRKN
ncbi:shikimate kinase [Pectinatus sottacetonis]|uniref:shikimate kinase n=1 Tax=Pectinatus sottacetonis TaxID=1002795 RepID=UPI0018C5D22A|nr:shikimate kinase [Pectinatus sottacetonis]